MSLIALPLLALHCTAQVWTQQFPNSATPPTRVFGSFAHDDQRDRFVLFGGTDGPTALNDTWEWDASAATWSQIMTSNTPQGRQAMAFAYDPSRGKTVIWGGATAGGPLSFFDDTWEYDGTNWQQVAAGPFHGRCGSRMCFDSQRQSLVLFGGQGNTFDNDLWTWDGSSWTQVMPGGAAAPPPRFFHAMAYDSFRDRVVVFGGTTGAAQLGDTWAWNGVTWTEITNPGPSARSQMNMVYDPAIDKMVMFGGFDANGQELDELWILSGDVWVQLTGNFPASRRRHILAHDVTSGHTTMYGGQNASLLDEVWELDLAGLGGAFSRVEVSLIGTTATPPPVTGHAMSALPDGGGLLFGGNGDILPFPFTYEIHGNDWAKQFSFNNPMARTGHSIALDEARQNNIMFGGANPVGLYLDDTWTYASGQWSPRSPGNRPAARSDHAMAYDPNTERTLLLGGRNGSGAALGDFWSWNGTTWVNLTPATLPPARFGHQMTWDALREVLVLFGGNSGTDLLNDVWEWDGVDWQQVSTTASLSPLPREGHMMTFAPRSERVVLLAGRRNLECLGDVWTWDGTDWTRHVDTTAAPPPRSGAAVYVDASIAWPRVFGGGCNPITNDLLEIQLPVFARWEEYGQGCPGSFGVPLLTVNPATAPVIGTTFELIQSNVPGGLLPTFGSFGLSRDLWLGVPLPLPLDPTGLVGCLLLQSTDRTFTLTPPVGGQVVWPVAVPNIGLLLGEQFYFQALHLELPGFPNWAALTNGIAIRIGEE